MPDVEQLYLECREALTGYFLRRHRSAQTAEDLLQETFLRLMRQVNRCFAASSPRGYLFGIARHVSADAWRRAVSTARDTIRQYPDLVTTAETETKVIPVFLWLARVAAVVAVAAIAGWIGYRAGHAGKTSPPVVESRVQGVWAQYQVAYDSRRGAFVAVQQD